MNDLVIKPEQGGSFMYVNRLFFAKKIFDMVNGKEPMSKAISGEALKLCVGNYAVTSALEYSIFNGQFRKSDKDVLLNFCKDMENDHEKETEQILIDAGRAFGFMRFYYDKNVGVMVRDDEGSGWWNPLEDGDAAFNLSCLLSIELRPSENGVDVVNVSNKVKHGLISVGYSGFGDDDDIVARVLASRRAVVLMAAQIGRNLVS